MLLIVLFLNTISSHELSLENVYMPLPAICGEYNCSWIYLLFKISRRLILFIDVALPKAYIAMAPGTCSSGL